MSHLGKSAGTNEPLSGPLPAPPARPAKAALDLDAIEARALRVNTLPTWDPQGSTGRGEWRTVDLRAARLSARDVPALIAEVRTLHRKHETALALLDATERCLDEANDKLLAASEFLARRGLLEAFAREQRLRAEEHAG